MAKTTTLSLQTRIETKNLHSRVETKRFLESQQEIEISEIARIVITSLVITYHSNYHDMLVYHNVVVLFNRASAITRLHLIFIIKTNYLIIKNK